MMLDDGKLEYDDKELGRAISRQASLITAQHYLAQLMERVLDWLLR
jgi:hypothetical protein